MQCSVSQAENCHRAKTFLTEELILPELVSDNLSDVPMIFLIIARVIAMFLRKIVRPKKKYSDSETSSEESDSTSKCRGNHVGERRHNAKFRTFYWKSRGETNSM
jgi:hypothetical protein